MAAKNIKELETMILKEMKKSMHVSSEKMLADMYEEMGKFYTGNSPIIYQRTGALGDTPRTTPLKSTSNSISFDAYLDLNHNYTTGKNPNIEDILFLAGENKTQSSVGYLRPTVGKLQPWEEIEKKIERELNQTMKKFFKKV